MGAHSQFQVVFLCEFQLQVTKMSRTAGQWQIPGPVSTDDNQQPHHIPVIAFHGTESMFNRPSTWEMLLKRGQFWKHIQTPVPLSLPSPTSQNSFKSINYRHIREHKAVRGHTKTDMHPSKMCYYSHFFSGSGYFSYTQKKCYLC